MNVNFGLFPPIETPVVEGRKLRGPERGVARKRALSARALEEMERWASKGAKAEADFGAVRYSAGSAWSAAETGFGHASSS